MTKFPEKIPDEWIKRMTEAALEHSDIYRAMNNTSRLDDTIAYPEKKDGVVDAALKSIPIDQFSGGYKFFWEADPPAIDVEYKIVEPALLIEQKEQE